MVSANPKPIIKGHFYDVSSNNKLTMRVCVEIFQSRGGGGKVEEQGRDVHRTCLKDICFALG